MCGYARRQVIKRVRDFYPAPLRAIDAVKRGMGMGVLKGSMAVEKPLLLDLMASSVSAHLVGLFLKGEEVKRKAVSVSEPVTRVGVLGAGLMGSQIAGQLAEKGYSVVLRDVASDILGERHGEDPSGSIRPGPETDHPTLRPALSHDADYPDYPAERSGFRFPGHRGSIGEAWM